jgi:hypothetical protein
MKTIADRWAVFDRVVLSKAGVVQRKEMRRAFYAGFHESLLAMLDMANESGENDDVGETMIARLHKECEQFAADIAAGKA